jgi:peptidoglycan/LPS O-acetylase OafA/YrhL
MSELSRSATEIAAAETTETSKEIAAVVDPATATPVIEPSIEQTRSSNQAFTSSSIADQLDPKRNSIGFLRLMLALMVIFSHSSELGGFGDDVLHHMSYGVYSFGALAVNGFFLLSGCLIAASFMRTRSLPIFVWHRVLRIFPGYWVCLLVTAIALPLLFGRSPDLGYALHNFLVPAISPIQAALGLLTSMFLSWNIDLQKIIAKIPFLLEQTEIPPLFSDNPKFAVVNGSLWSLAHEFRLYFLVALLGILGLLRKHVVVVLLIVVWIAYCLMFYKLGKDPAVGLRTTTYFLMGTLFYFWRPPIKRSLVIAAVIASLVAMRLNLCPVVFPVTNAYLIFWLAAALPFQGFARKWDYSYGLYIYSAPVQQALAAFHLNRWGFPVFLLLSVVFSGALAVLSWHLVESTAMSWKKGIPQFWKLGWLSRRTAQAD